MARALRFLAMPIRRRASRFNAAKSSPGILIPGLFGNGVNRASTCQWVAPYAQIQEFHAVELEGFGHGAAGSSAL